MPENPVLNPSKHSLTVVYALAAVAVATAIGLSGCSANSDPSSASTAQGDQSATGNETPTTEGKLPVVNANEFSTAFNKAMTEFYDTADAEGKAVSTTGSNTSGSTRVEAKNVRNPDGSLLSTNTSSDGNLNIEVRCLPDLSCYISYDGGETWMVDTQTEQFIGVNPREQADGAIASMSESYPDLEYRMTERAFEMSSPSSAGEGMFYEFTPNRITFLSNIGGEQVQSVSTLTDPISVEKPTNIVEPETIDPAVSPDEATSGQQ